jgi:PhoH-like ATPase
MRKTYILDTSAIVQDPQAHKNYPNSDVIIPITVLDELDKLKKQSNEAGKNARVASRILDTISDLGDISTGILLENDVLLKIDVENYEGVGDALYGDTRILACAKSYAEAGADVCLVSNDINLRIRAKALSLGAESYDKDRTSLSDIFSGVQTVQHSEAGADLLNDGFIDPRCYSVSVNPNEYVIFIDEFDKEIAIGKAYSYDHLKLIRRSYPWDISPRNKEQVCAIDAIMDPKIPLVTLIGKAGCGKTMITLASALELVLNKNQYDKLVIYRPIQPVGNDIGYLPGTLEEKLMPWFQAIMDNFEILFGGSHGDRWKVTFEAAKKRDRIQMEALTYIRGRSIPNAIILIDEAQNLSKEEVKTILTRAGENTKIILTGDIEQIDNSSLDALNNGLTYVIDKFKDSELASHVTFVKGERSKLATQASLIM